MAYTLSRIDRKTRTYELSATVLAEAAAIPPDLTGVDVALLPPRGAPTASTVWFSADYDDGSFTVLLAGPDADSTGALVVTGSADIWMKIADAPEVDAEKLERIIVLGASSVAAMPPTYVTSINGQSGDLTIPIATDATTVAKGVVQLAGDLGGTAAAPTVPGLAAKAPLASPAFTGSPTGITKTHVGLGNVDNTADTAKPVSTAQQTAIDLAKARANHTGTQSADTLTDGTTNKAFLATERTKLTGIATGATANATDAQLRDRSTHTGTQAASTVTGLATVATTGSYNDLTGKPTLGTAAAQDTTAFDAAGAAALARMAADTPIPSTGKYISAGGTGTTAPGIGAMRSYPLTLGGPGTADRIGIEVTVGAAGNVGLAIYAHDTATGLPGALILDAGTIDVSTTGFKEITISQALPAGTCWLTYLAATAAPTVRAVAATAPVVLPVTVQADLATVPIAAVRTGQSTMPNPFAATAMANNTPRVYLRFS